MIEESIRERFERGDREAIALMLEWTERMTRKVDSVVDGGRRDEIEPAIAELRTVLSRLS